MCNYQKNHPSVSIKNFMIKIGVGGWFHPVEQENLQRSCRNQYRSKTKTKIMNAELIKELLGSKLEQCTVENFKNGYDPIVDLIDELEGDEQNSDAENDEWIEVTNFLDKMSSLTPDDENYDTINSISYCNNGFYYSKKEDDIFWNEWKNWKYKDLGRQHPLFWYFYFLNRRISKNLIESNGAFSNCAFEINKYGDYVLVKYDNDNQSIEPDDN